MKYLLDASALLPLITRRGRGLIAEASRENLVTTDLAIYEACNSLWKLAALLKSISVEDAVDIADTLKDLAVRGLIHTVNFLRLDLSVVLEIAHRELLTFYDASYIVAAEGAEAILVTDDEKLLKIAGKFVKTLTYPDFEETMAQT